MNNDKLLAVDDDGLDDEDDVKDIEQLALNSNFDPSLLDCWEEAAAAAANGSATNSLPGDTTTTGDSKLPAHAAITTAGSSASKAPTGTAMNVDDEDDDDAAWDEFDKAAQESLLLATGTSPAPTPAMANSPPPPSFNISSVRPNSRASDETNPTLPPFETTTTGLQQRQLGPPPSTQAAPILFPVTANPAPGLESAALLPLAFNALAAGVDLSSFFNAAQSASSGLPGQDGETAVAAAAAAATAATAEGGASSHNPLLPQPPPTTRIPKVAAASAAPTEKESEPAAASRRTTKKRAASGRRGKSSAKGKGAQQKKGNEEEEEEPPFMLFDAPVELRHNFMQSQRALGLPLLQDNNSYHFARSSAVSASTTPTMGSSSLPMVSASSNGAMPRLADARHGDDVSGSKRIKNAKEQKRAQRITELIEQLRVRMEKGGWKVGMKSKLHTLSSCSDYVKHLVKVTKEKEAAVEKAKSDLEAKRRKIEEEKSSQQDPSEPESTTSSLTMSSGSRQPANKKTSTHNDSGGGNGGDAVQKPHSGGQPTKPSQQTSGNRAASEESEESPSNKRKKLSSQESNNSGGGYSSSIEGSSNKKLRTNGGVGQHVSIGPVSSVSDITDNNKYKGSSAATSSSDDNTMTAAQGGNKNLETPEDNAAPTTPGDDEGPTQGPVDPSAQNTVCSDAAVAETSDPNNKDNSHDGSSGHMAIRPEMMIQTITTKTSSRQHHHHHHKKRKLQQDPAKASKKTPRDATSLESSFRLDYEEVFLKSNVPQIISSTTGRIVSFNEIFLHATRLHRSQLERLTIFSLVQPSMLSNLFELVASSLREDDEQEKRGDKDQEPPVTGASTPLQDYSTMTLPCVHFHTDCPPLFMTITLMTDEDVKKRCFHCVFTDCAPGTNGAVGSVTPQLLATLFQPLTSSSSNAGQSGSSDGSQGKSSLTTSKSSSGGGMSSSSGGEKTQSSNDACLSGEKSAGSTSK